MSFTGKLFVTAGAPGVSAHYREGREYRKSQRTKASDEQDRGRGERRPDEFCRICAQTRRITCRDRWCGSDAMEGRQ